MRKYFSIIIIFSVIIGFYSCSLFCKCPESGSILTLQPGPEKGIDAFIEEWPKENYSNTNRGDYDAIAAAAWTAQGITFKVRCLIKFDLSNICARTKIRKATLSLYAIETPGIGKGHSTMSGPNNFELLKVASPWNEHEVTWNTQPEITEENKIVLPATDSVMQDYTDIDVTALVQEMIRYPSENYGLMIKLINENYYRRVLFGSSDNENIQKRPKLVIEF